MDVTINCPCPDKAGEPRHVNDTVTLADRLDFRSAVTVRKAIGLLYNEDPDASSAETLALLTEHYLLFGITGWSLVDEKGKPVGVTRAAIRAFMDAHQDEAMTVADAADDLYSEQVLLPLLARASSSSPSGPTAGSTSAQKASTTRRPKPSSPSSTTSTRTDSTARITSLPAGVASTSPKNVSAA